MEIQLLATNMILYCKQWTQTVHFYKDLLSLPVLFENDWFVEFGLNSISRLSIADEKRASIKSNKGTGITIALETANIDPLWKQMENAKLNPTPTRAHPWNARVFYIFDPEGHRIEIWQKTKP